MKYKNYLFGTILIFASFICAADTIKTLRINSDLSNIFYSGNTFTYNLSGTFDMHFLETPPPTPGITFPALPGNLRLENDNITTDTLPDIDFTFPRYISEISGTDVIGDANFCRWETTPGTCISSGFQDDFTGTFDGHTLIITGIDHLSLHRSPNYTYTITATVVPLPGSFILLFSGLSALLAFTSKSLTSCSSGRKKHAA